MIILDEGLYDALPVMRIRETGGGGNTKITNNQSDSQSIDYHYMYSSHLQKVQARFMSEP